MVRGLVVRLRSPRTQMTRHRRRDTPYLPTTIAPAERGKPVAFRGPALGRDVARQPDNAAGTGFGSKRKPRGNRGDTGCATAGNITRRASGLTSRRSSVTRDPLANRFR